MKARGGSKIIEKNKCKIRVDKSRKRRHVEYSTISCKVVVTFIVIFEMCRRESV
jgi:hypothetical protein